MPQGEPQEFVDQILRQAVADGASDLYLIPSGGLLTVRSRMNGVQKEIAALPSDYGQCCVSRLKVLAGLLTYRTRVSQDGAIRGLEGAPDAEFRVAVMPTESGERVSIRLLNACGRVQSIDDLGFAEPVRESLRAMLRQPSGMIVLTGPTGSGKTTTIYAMVQELLKEQCDPASIVTIEDPVEADLAGVSQVSVSGESEWGYAEALRSALRQDVKTLVIGEMRDREVVRVTLDAALTGHRIITTYHSGDIPSVYTRLLHQGFEPFLVSSALTGIVAQRLVHRADADGRLALAAVLTPDDAWRDFVTTSPSLTELRRRIRTVPGADLPTVVQQLINSGTISPDTVV